MKSFSELTSASQVNNADLLAISQTSGSGYASKKTTVKDITDKSNLNLAEEYDSTSTYAVDDYVIYESVLYKCIGTTTGTFDSTKWTSVVVTDEMGSGGGGGTGGHTIIDENGNSMTARAGLQFVGGANVSDDATNNKTIVDLASAGGIDGVFIDTGNVIKSATNFRSSLTYTATEDCAFCLYLVTKGNTSAQVRIDGIAIIDYWKSSMDTPSFPQIFLKKGQILSVANANESYDSTYRVYGIQTGTTHSKFQPVIYSTEEREVGVWTDGKPLYQKSVLLSQYNVSLSDNVWTNIFAVTNWETLVAAEINTQTPNTKHNLRFQLLSGYVQGASKENINLSTYNNLYVTFCYTKSTDIAGSGTWTPQGVPSVHYSTDEQVIGTYLGETLYQRTFDLGTDLLVSTSSWTTLGITLDADKIVETKTTSTSGSFQGNILIYNDNGTWKGQTPRNGNDSSYVRYLTIAYTKSS